MGLKQANTELKQTIRKDLNIDDIDDIADDMAELMYDFEEMNEVLGRNFSTPEYIDEDELEAELDMLDDELEQEIEQDTTPTYLQPSAMPSTPTNTPGSKVPAAPK